MSIYGSPHYERAATKQASKKEIRDARTRCPPDGECFLERVSGVSLSVGSGIIDVLTSIGVCRWYLNSSGIVVPATRCGRSGLPIVD